MELKPTPKSDRIDAVLTAMTGKSRAEVISGGSCMMYGVTNLTAESFRDELSRREYCISGMCQKCQDSVFNSDQEEY